MRTLCAIMIFSTIFPSVLQAQDKCLEIEDLYKRYECWGSAAPGIRPEELAKVAAANKKWIVSKQKSDMTDDTNVDVSVESQAPVYCHFGDAPAELTLQCFENTTRVILGTECHVASGFETYGTVEYRVDDRPMARRSFDASTDNRALGLWRYSQSRPFIEDILDGETLRVRFTPYGENMKEATFDISGLRETIEPLRSECGW